MHVIIHLQKFGSCLCRWTAVYVFIVLDLVVHVRYSDATRALRWPAIRSFVQQLIATNKNEISKVSKRRDKWWTQFSSRSGYFWTNDEATHHKKTHISSPEISYNFQLRFLRIIWCLNRAHNRIPNKTSSGTQIPQNRASIVQSSWSLG